MPEWHPTTRKQNIINQSGALKNKGGQHDQNNKTYEETKGVVNITGIGGQDDQNEWSGWIGIYKNYP